MTGKHLLITFLAAGLILALIAGVYVYQMNLHSLLVVQTY